MDTPLLFAMAAVIIGFVILTAVVFLRRALARARELGIEKSVVKETVRVSAVFSVVPSIPIVIGLAAMVPLLGLALPWIRLSVIGSVQYELFAANAAATATGTMTGGLLGTEAFNTAAWVMTISISGGLFFCLFFLKKYENSLDKLKQKDERWADVLVTAIFMGLVGTIGAQQIAKYTISPIYPITLGVSAALMIVLGLVMKKTKAKWLEGFAMPLSMLGALAVAFALAANWA